MEPKVCVVAGVGPGNGTAFTRKFAGAGYRVAMLARTEERLAALEAEIPGTRGYVVDIGDTAAVERAFARIRSDLGPVDVLVHNAAAGAFTAFMDTPPALLETTLRTNTISLLLLGQQAARDMLAHGAGAIVVIGNTSAWRGVANYAGFAPSKAAQRILAQSMARSLGPRGVHVAYVVVDAVIDVPWARSFFADKPDEFFCRPAAIAETVFHVAHQDRSAWTFELDVRPFGEKW
jgi:NAD(P)-dependent dehydrogenase (short-subunit alcohol dehydrogenase family)